jgi:hypothetical protein
MTTPIAELVVRQSAELAQVYRLDEAHPNNDLARVIMP